MKIGRNDPCPCGSGKKYKKCCIDKGIFNTNDNLNYIDNSIDFVGSILAQHNTLLHTKEVKNEYLNNKLLNIYDNKDKLSTKEVINDYLEIMNYMLDYAKNNNIKTIKELDGENIISDSLINIIGDLDLEIYNLEKDDYDLNITNRYNDKLINTLDLDDNTYENALRCKTFSLFKLGEYDKGEKVMLDLIKEKRNSIFAYIELVDDYKIFGNLEKAKYYYDLGMQQTNLKDKDDLEERYDYFK